MPEVIFPGPEGRLEGRFHPGTRPRAPVALILHSHPQAGGTMNNKIVQLLYQTFVRRGFATLRFNFRGTGRSTGSHDGGRGEQERRNDEGTRTSKAAAERPEFESGSSHSGDGTPEFAPSEGVCTTEARQ